MCARWIHRLVVLLLVWTAAAASAVSAMDKQKAASATAQQASGALERGDHAQAAHLYLEAYKLDPATSDYLYGAARETQAVGDADRAEELYGQYLALVGIDPRRAENARRYVGELRADGKAKEAERMRGRGNGGLAAQLYREAWVLDPTRTVFLLRGARAAEDAQSEPLAKQLLTEFLRHAPVGDANRGEAQARLDALTPRPAARPAEPLPPPRATESERPVVPAAAPTVPAPAQATPAAVVNVPRTQSSSLLPAWVALGSGGALVVAGVAVWASTVGDRNALESALLQRQDGLVSGVSLQDAQVRNSSIVNRNIVAGVLGGIGVAALGVGTWLWLRAEGERAAVFATPDGAVFAARW